MDHSNSWKKKLQDAHKTFPTYFHNQGHFCWITSRMAKKGSKKKAATKTPMWLHLAGVFLLVPILPHWTRGTHKFIRSKTDKESEKPRTGRNQHRIYSEPERNCCLHCRMSVLLAVPPGPALESEAAGTLLKRSPPSPFQGGFATTDYGMCVFLKGSKNHGMLCLGKRNVTSIFHFFSGKGKALKYTF